MEERIFRSVLWIAVFLFIFGMDRPLHSGVLGVHPTNPRYFTTNGTDALYLAGSQAFANINTAEVWRIYHNDDNTFEEFLDWMQAHGQNFTRLWTCWSYIKNASTGAHYSVPPFPWKRSDVGGCIDGGHKFDLTSFNQSYFDILSERVGQIQARGMYCSVMFLGSLNRNHRDFTCSIWHPDNNINKMNFDPNDYTTFYTTDTHDLDIQKMLVAKVLDTLNAYDNVMFEIANEGLAAIAWEKALVHYAKSYESGLAKRHLIGISGYKNWTTSDAASGPHDWFSPDDKIDIDGIDFRTGGSPSYSSKPIIFDSDHYDGGIGRPYWLRSEGGDAYPAYVPGIREGLRRAWKNFCRGHHNLLLDTYECYWPLYNDNINRTVNPVYDPVRDALGKMVHYANRFDHLAKMNPSTTIANTGYCLYNPGTDYIVFQPKAGSITVQLSEGHYNYETYDIRDGSLSTDAITAWAGEDWTVRKPSHVSEGWVLYIHITRRLPES